MIIVQIKVCDGEDMSPYYWRNNRNDGAKNLQCFPHCIHRHDGRQFCGKTLHAMITFRIHRKEYCNLDSFHWDEYYILGQFSLSTESCLLPKIVPFKDYLKEKKSIHNLLGEYYEGIECLSGHSSSNSKWIPVEDGNSYEFTKCYEFNRELLGWHYGWTSNKHRANDKHVFTISVYQRYPNTQLTLTSAEAALSPENYSLHLIGRDDSPSFLVKSARRKSQHGGNPSPTNQNQQSPLPSKSTLGISAPTSAIRVPLGFGEQPVVHIVPTPLEGLGNLYQRMKFIPTEASGTRMGPKKVKNSTAKPLIESRQCSTPPPSSATIDKISPASHQTNFLSTVQSPRKKKYHPNRKRAVTIIALMSRMEIEDAASQTELYRSVMEGKRLERIVILKSLNERARNEIYISDGRTTTNQSSDTTCDTTPCPVKARSASSTSSSSTTTDEDQVHPLPILPSLPSKSSHPLPLGPRSFRRTNSGDWSNVMTTLSHPPSFSYQDQTSPPDFDVIFGSGGLDG